jgi:nitrite reductase/ring-hydroxylating ferredoxin subunit
MTVAHKTRHAIATVGELPPGARKVVRVPTANGAIEIGVFNVGGRLVAYRNVCPHAGAPVCEGRVCGTTLASEAYEYQLARDGEILRCPWHGWEFDLLTGEHLVHARTKLRAYDVETQETQSAHAPTDGLDGFAVETDASVTYILI